MALLNKIRDNDALSEKRLNGFTLVEMLIVLFIIGLIAGITVITMSNPRGALVNEAEKLAGRVIAARDNAILQSRPMALAYDASGYRFEQRRDGAWQPHADGPFAFTAWREETVVQRADGTDKRLIFDPVGLASADMQVVLTHGSDNVRIEIARNGEVRVGE